MSRSFVATLALSGLAAGGVGCSVALEAPPESRIHCAALTDCPTGFTCVAEIGRCVPQQVGQSSATLVSVSATSPTEVTVVLSAEVLADGAGGPAVWGITDSVDEGVAVLAVAVGEDGKSVRLETAPQVPQRPYTLDMPALIDRAGGVVPASSSAFIGFGAADTSPPVITTPSQGSAASLGGTPVQWSLPDGAKRFVVEVALDANFTTLALGSPYTDVLLPSHLVAAEEPTTHWVRVRADVTTPGVWSEPVTFEPVGLVLHVYCPADASCAPSTAGEPAEVGNRTRPFRSVGRAIDAAVARGALEVRIAGRGAAAVYDEALFVNAQSLMLLGGYSESFAPNERDSFAHPTVLRAPALMFHRIGSGSGPRLVDGLILESAPGPELTGTILLEAGPTLVVRNSTLRIDAQGGSQATTLLITGAGGPRLEDVSIECRGAASCVGLASIAADVEIERGTFRLEGDGECIGMQMFGGAPQFRDVDLEVRCNQSDGLFVGGGTFRWEGGRVATSGTSATGLAMGGSLAELDRAVITVSSPSVALIAPLQAGSVTTVITNTVLHVANDGGAARAISAFGDILDIAGSTVVMPPGGTCNSAVVETPDSGAVRRFVNNLVLCHGGTMWSDLPGERPAAARNNALVDCSVVHRTDSCASPMDPSLASFEDLDGPGGDLAGNLALVLGAEQIFVDANGPDGELSTWDDNDWRLRADLTNLRQGGLDLSSLCGGGGELPCLGTDLVDAPRTPPLSIGAYEGD